MSKAVDNVSVSRASDSMPIMAMSRSFTTTNTIFHKLWNPMTIEGQFILLMVADTYLTHDYEFSLRISTTDFSFIAIFAI